jgi:hypothetical protein
MQLHEFQAFEALITRLTTVEQVSEAINYVMQTGKSAFGDKSVTLCLNQLKRISKKPDSGDRVYGVDQALIQSERPLTLSAIYSGPMADLLDPMTRAVNFLRAGGLCVDILIANKYHRGDDVEDLDFNPQRQLEADVATVIRNLGAEYGEFAEPSFLAVQGSFTRVSLTKRST